MFKKLRIAIGLISQIAVAEVYQWKDDDGNTHYSDSKPKDMPELQATNIVIPTTIPPIKAAPKTKETGPQVIFIDNKTSGQNCTSEKLNSTSQNDVLDAWQDSEWKKCRGMK